LVDHDAELFLNKLEEWLATQEGRPTVADIIRTGNFAILAGFVLRIFGYPGLASPVDGAGRGDATECDNNASANPAMRIFAGLARAWALSFDERVALLCVSSSAELAALQKLTMKDVPSNVVERLVILLDIFKALNTLFPVHARADEWIRRPSTASLFGGRSPLWVMTESPDGIRSVQRYLQAEVWGS
jgi:hypothetical protein